MMLLKCCTQYARFNMSFPDSSLGKESACSVGDLSLIPQLGRSPGEGNSYPLQYSGLENSMNCYSSWGRKETQLSDLRNMPASLENSAMATGLEKVSFHSSPKENQCQRMFRLPHNCTHLTLAK